MEFLTDGKISMDNMELAIKHLRPHKNGQINKRVKKEVEERLFLILRKYERREQDEL